MSRWLEGARAYDPLDACPRCKKPPHFASQFKKFGSHTVIACADCGLIFHNDDAPQAFMVYPKPPDVLVAQTDR